MGLKEQSDTYFQNLQTIQQHQLVKSISKTQGLVYSPSPNLNDLLLDPYRKVEMTTNKSCLNMTEESMLLQNSFSKTASSFIMSSNNQQTLPNQSPFKKRNLSHKTENNKNLSKSTVLSTSDMAEYRSLIQKTPPRMNSNLRQSMMNMTSKENSPDPIQRFGDLQVSYSPYVQIKQKYQQAQAQYLNANLPSNTISSTQNMIHLKNNTNSAQRLLNLSATSYIGNKNMYTTLNLNNNKQKQKKVVGSYRIQPSYSPILGVSQDQMEKSTEVFIPINL